MQPTLDCWKYLDLPADSDERTLKRQYARLLKVTRPDDDPVAFQRLREAYEQALQLLREGGDLPQRADLIAPSMFHTQLPPNLAPNLAPSAHENAVELLSEFDDWKVDDFWARASAQGCAAEFEQLLFQRCVSAPDRHLMLLTWGVEQRQWLTPWQHVQSGGFPHQRLVFALTTALYADLEQFMKDAQQAHFFALLERASQQGWLLDFAYRQALQMQVLNLFTTYENWSPPLFQQVCRLFSWDVEGASPPIDETQWQILLRRCEQQAWLRQLRALAEQREQQPCAEANAAALFLMCTEPLQQKELAATFGEADWQACGQLSVDFSTRFADLLGLFPNHNPWFWQSLIGERPTRYGVKHAASVLAICLALANLSSEFALVPMLLMLPLYALGGYLMALVGKWLLTYWTAMAQSLHDIDQRASRWCVRHKLISDRRYLVIRNSGALLALGFVIWKWIGLLGLATYAVTGLIGVLQPASALPVEHEHRWRRPLQAIYRMAGLSWLQWLFCMVMIGVIAYLQLEVPGTLLTRGSWR